MDLEDELFGDDDADLSSAYLPVASDSNKSQAQNHSTPSSSHYMAHPPIPPLLNRNQASSELPISFDVAYDDWHLATEKLECSLLDKRLDESLTHLRSRNSGGHMLPTKERNAELEVLRRKDEINGCHRRQLDRETRAAQLVIQRMETWRGWNGALDTGAVTSRHSMMNSASKGRLRLFSRKKKSKGNNTHSNEHELMLESPIRALFGGLTQLEPKLSRLDNDLVNDILMKTDRNEAIEDLSSYLQIILRVPPIRLTSNARNLWVKVGAELGSKHSLGSVASAYAVVMSGLYDAACVRAENRGSSARPAVDYAANDVRAYIAFLQAIILWKWQEKLMLIARNENTQHLWVQMAMEEPARGVLEALDRAVLPSNPVVYRLFRASSQDVDEALSSKLGQLARIDPLQLCALLGIGSKFQMDIAKIRSHGADGGLGEVSSGGLDGTFFGPALAELRKIAATLSPILKATAIAKTCRALCLAVGHWKHQQTFGASQPVVGESLAADDMLPMLMLLIIFGCVTESYGGSLRSLEAEGAYMECFLPQHLAASEDGYCLVLFRTAVGALHSIMPPNASLPPPIAEFTEITEEIPIAQLQLSASNEDEEDEEEDLSSAANYVFSATGVDSTSCQHEEGSGGGTPIASIESIVNRASDLGLQGD